MALPDGDLLQRIGGAVTAAAGESWRSATLSITGLSAATSARLMIERQDGSLVRATDLADEALLWCDDLRDEMYADGEGTWYNATITVTADGQIESTFDYDTPPFAGEVTDDLLLDDQEAYPRAADRLPVWHPSRTALA
ncbi:hypothetical protein [Promicromonospora soli]